jgi:hypothetical protein
LEVNPNINSAHSVPSLSPVSPFSSSIDGVCRIDEIEPGSSSVLSVDKIHDKDISGSASSPLSLPLLQTPTPSVEIKNESEHDIAMSKREDEKEAVMTTDTHKYWISFVSNCYTPHTTRLCEMLSLSIHMVPLYAFV